MNFYPFHIGDYASATRHLSWDEDAAYRRMLDVYYTSERALPADVKKLFRLVMATSKAQRDAVQSVLDEFFELTEAGWINRRADLELASMHEKQAATEEKDVHERDRMKRYRERRAVMFEALRGLGIVPNWDVSMKDLQRLVETHCNAPETELQREQVVAGASPATAIPIPTPLPIQIPVPKNKRALTDSKPDNRGGESPEPGPHASAEAPPISRAGAACKAMRAAGLPDANPSHPKLDALLKAGVSTEELADAAIEAVKKGKGFAYALATAEGRRRDAAEVGDIPVVQADPESRSAIEAEGIAKGIGPWNELTEQFSQYKRRVRGDVAGFAPSLVNLVGSALRKATA